MLKLVYFFCILCVIYTPYTKASANDLGINLSGIVAGIVIFFIGILIYKLFSKSNNFNLDDYLTNNNDNINSIKQPIALLPDRAQFRQAFESDWCENKADTVLVLLKFDGLSEINQHLGHELGDVLLTQTALKIKKLLSEQAPLLALTDSQRDIVKLAHLSSVDFVFAVDIAKQKYLHEVLIQSIQQLTEIPVTIKGCTLKSRLQTAYAINSDKVSFDELISRTYLAMDLHHFNYSNVIQYQPEMLVNRNNELTMISELTKLNFDEDFELYFHPVIELKTHKIEFIELLLRWKHPEKGLLAAQDFIKEIVLSGLAYQVTIWVLEKAAELAMVLNCQGCSTPVSVNLFGSELLQDELVEHIDSLMFEHKLSRGALIIECPADLLIELDDYGASMIKRLKNIGLPVCLDDLGASPLMLSYLPQLAFDYIKIDGELIHEFSNDINARTLLGGIIDMGKNLNSKVICEGVESEQLLEFISSLKCFAGQGYVFSQPLSILGASSWLVQWDKKRENKQIPYQV